MGTLLQGDPCIRKCSVRYVHTSCANVHCVCTYVHTYVGVLYVLVLCNYATTVLNICIHTYVLGVLCLLHCMFIICTYVCTYTYVHTYVHILTYVYTHVYMLAYYMYVCVCAYHSKYSMYPAIHVLFLCCASM